MNTLSMDSITDLFRFDVFCRRLDWVPRFLEGFLLCLRNFGDLCGLRDTKVMFGTQLKVYTERGISTLKSLVPSRFKWNFRWVILKLILVIDCWGISCEIVLKCMPVDDKAALVQAMAWCRQATSHYLSQCWPRSMSPYGVTRPRWVNVWCLFDTKQKFVFTIIHEDRWHRHLISLLIENKGPLILHSQYHGCWWAGDARSQGINRHGLDLVLV